MSATVVPIPGGRVLRHRLEKWSDTMTNVSIPEVNMLKKAQLAVSVQINLTIKLGYVSVNGPRETYFGHATYNPDYRKYYLTMKEINQQVITEQC